MYLLQIAHAGRPVCRRAHERMTETHPRAELDVPRGLSRRRRVGADPEPLRRAPQQGHVADGLGRRRKEQPSGLYWKRLKLAEETPLYLARQRRRVGKRESARQLRRGQPTRKLEQGERVAARLGDDPVA